MNTMLSCKNIAIASVNIIDGTISALNFAANPSQDTAAQLVRIGARFISFAVNHKSPAAFRCLAVAANVLNLYMPAPTTPSFRDFLISTIPLPVDLGLNVELHKIAEAVQFPISVANMLNIGLPQLQQSSSKKTQ